jgi:hypothetical protein
MSRLAPSVVRGQPGNPMTAEEVKAKARDLMTAVIGGPDAEELISRLVAIEEVADVRQLAQLWRLERTASA